jgi:hypothetical protein
MMHKRSCFEFEKEWRAALYQDLRPGVLGCSIQCSLDDLISAVYVGPRATDFFAQIVGAVMEKFALHKPLHKSELLESPPSGDC